MCGDSLKSAKNSLIHYTSLRLLFEYLYAWDAKVNVTESVSHRGCFHIHYYTSLRLLFSIIMHLLMSTCLCYPSVSILDLHAGENIPYGSLIQYIYAMYMYKCTCTYTHSEHAHYITKWRIGHTQIILLVIVKHCALYIPNGVDLYSNHRS